MARGEARRWVSFESLLASVRRGRPIDPQPEPPRWVKAASTRAESDLRFAALLTFLAPARLPDDAWTGAAQKLGKAWDTLVEIQCRSVWDAPSLEEIRRGFARIEKTTDKLIDQGTTRWLEGMSSEGLTRPLAVFNPCMTARSGVVEFATAEGEPPERCYVNGVPAAGVRIVDRARPMGVVPSSADEAGRLSNGAICAAVDEGGRLMLTCGGHDGAAPTEFGPLCVLVVGDEGTEETPEREAAVELLDSGPLRSAIRVRAALQCGSTVGLTYVVDAGSRRVDVYGEVDWRSAGSLWLAFETPGRSGAGGSMWVSRGDRENGVAILGDCALVTSDDEGVLAVLVADETGTSEFLAALLPLGEGFDVDAEAEAVRSPLLAFALNAGEPGPLGTVWTPFELKTDGAGTVVVAAIEPAFEPGSVVLHLHETAGRDVRIVIRRIAGGDGAGREATLEMRAGGHASMVFNVR
mgnify:CR=1 FL=1